MEQYQQRVVNEQIELEKKVNDLYGFVHGIMDRLVEDKTEQYLLRMQLDAMAVYNEILLKRIEKFKA